jgi:hypothetical protein
MSKANYKKLLQLVKGTSSFADGNNGINGKIETKYSSFNFIEVNINKCYMFIFIISNYFLYIRVTIAKLM